MDPEGDGMEQPLLRTHDVSNGIRIKAYVKH